LKTAIGQTGDSVVEQILNAIDIPQLTKEVFTCVAPYMRVLNRIEDCVLAKDFKPKQHSEQIQQYSQEFLSDEHLKDLPEALQSRYREVCATFTEKDTDEQRAQRLSVIMQLRLALIRHCAEKTKRKVTTKS
jgi:hypothetical protein